MLTIVVGGAGTLLLSEGQIRNWAKNSGTRFPVGQWENLDLQYGEFLVFYESAEHVPESYLLQIVDPYGDRMRSSPAPEAESYRLMLSGWSGKAIGVLRIEEAGTYQVRCSNASVASDAEVPADDRIVVRTKQPISWVEASQIRKQILVVGASVTFALFVVFYIVHGLALRSRARRSHVRSIDDIDQTMDVAV